MKNTNGIMALFSTNIPNGYCKLAINGNRREFKIYITTFHVINMAPKPIPTTAKLKYPTLPKYSGSSNTECVPIPAPILPITTANKKTQNRRRNW